MFIFYHVSLILGEEIFVDYCPFLNILILLIFKQEDSLFYNFPFNVKNEQFFFQYCRLFSIIIGQENVCFEELFFYFFSRTGL